jgi:hypothetical protein
MDGNNPEKVSDVDSLCVATKSDVNRFWDSYMYELWGQPWTQQRMGPSSPRSWEKLRTVPPVEAIEVLFSCSQGCSVLREGSVVIVAGG